MSLSLKELSSLLGVLTEEEVKDQSFETIASSLQKVGFNKPVTFMQLLIHVCAELDVCYDLNTTYYVTQLVSSAKLTILISRKLIFVDCLFFWYCS